MTGEVLKAMSFVQMTVVSHIAAAREIIWG
jgi:hypothetical protein